MAKPQPKMRILSLNIFIPSKDKINVHNFKFFAWFFHVTRYLILVKLLKKIPSSMLHMRSQILYVIEQATMG